MRSTKDGEQSGSDGSTSFGRRMPGPTGVPQTCDNGCPAFLAYGSALDNTTGDATTLEPQYLSALSTAAITVIYPNQVGKQPVRRAVRH